MAENEDKVEEAVEETVEEKQEQQETEVQEESQDKEETQEQVEETEEDINIQDYWKERYTQPQSQVSQESVAKELSELPTDQYGNVDEKAAADWLTRKFRDVETAAERRAIQAAEKAVMGNLTEVNQQQQLLEKYPDLKKDRETLDTVFDLRDAAALRGQNLTLMEAAARLDKLRQQGRAEGTQTASKRTTIQAAAHLETASQRGGGQTQEANLLNKEDRHALLRQYVQKGLDSGEIQVPK